MVTTVQVAGRRACDVGSLLSVPRGAKMSEEPAPFQWEDVELPQGVDPIELEGLPEDERPVDLNPFNEDDDDD